MTEFKNVKRALEKALGVKARSITVPSGWKAGTIIETGQMAVYLFKMEDNITFYYATKNGVAISWHNNATDPETWVGENYSVKKVKDERSSLHIILDGICHLGHFAPECLEDALKALR